MSLKTQVLQHFNVIVRVCHIFDSDQVIIGVKARQHESGNFLPFLVILMNGSFQRIHYGAALDDNEMMNTADRHRSYLMCLMTFSHN